MKDTIVYTKNGCPYCDKIKKVFDHIQLEYEVKNLNEDFSREEFYEIFGNGSTFPQVIMNNEKLGGCVDTIKYLKNKNMV